MDLWEEDAMDIKLKPLNEQVMVITGASSGIGLATAEAAAEAGAKLVLAARSGETLRDIVQRLGGPNGNVVHVTGDVSEPDAIEQIAQAAVTRFGGIDTWVNNAAVSIYGRLDEVSVDDARRLFDVDSGASSRDR
jgi:NADP-dependent 3-hydroxy acid dehydrogenase YdfG